jgi:serine/threonine protein kinase
MLEPATLLQNRYRVVRPLGQGGMGAVYEATDERFGKTVAIKEAFLGADSLRRAFEREARLLNDLRHPALPVVIDYFAEGNIWFLVMDYVPGEDLGAYLKRMGKPFAPADVVRWADQVLDALEYLHGHEPPIIHRDIKPQNIKLTPRGDVKLLDFGLAKGVAASGTSGTSVAGYTPHYAPVEQIQGAGTDVRSDLYALGATMYHLMTGRIPPDALERAMKLLNGEPDPLRLAHELNAEIPTDVSEVLRRVLATSANQRPASAAAFRRALREASGLAWPVTSPSNRATAPPVAEAPATIVAGRAVRTAPAAAPVPTERATTAAPTRTGRARWLAVPLAAVALAAGGYGIYRVVRPPVRVPPEVVKTPPPELRALKFETLAVGERGAIVERRKAVGPV